MEKENQVSTEIKEENVDIDSLFGIDNVMLPEGEEEKKSIFTKEDTDLSFLNEETKTEEQSEVNPVDEIVSEMNELEDLITTQEQGTSTKKDRDALHDLVTKMIEEGKLMPFDDGKPLEEYSVKDIRELFEANFEEQKSKLEEELPRQFFESLPEELQVAAKYVADGGKDLKGLFKTLTQVEEIFELDPENEDHQERIARQYLQATKFGTDEEIEEEINEWKDLNRLGVKAKQFKPKLDKMQEEIVQSTLEQQEKQKIKQQEAAKNYMDSVYTTIDKGELAGIKLDNKTKNLLFSGLTQPSYASVTGKPTNLLGHLLEKYQFVEPNHELIAEALWLLQDPEGYRSKVKQLGGNEEVEKTVKLLKTEQSKKTVTSVKQESSKPTLKRPQRNIFK